jgi:hypothetical protein
MITTFIACIVSIWCSSSTQLLTALKVHWIWMDGCVDGTDIFSVSLLELQCFQLINFRLLLLLSCWARSHSVCLMYFLLALF